MCGFKLIQKSSLALIASKASSIVLPCDFNSGLISRQLSTPCIFAHSPKKSTNTPSISTYTIGLALRLRRPWNSTSFLLRMSVSPNSLITSGVITSGIFILLILLPYGTILFLYSNASCDFSLLSSVL